MSESEYIELNKLTRHDLVTLAISLRSRVACLQAERDLVSKALDGHVNKGVSGEASMILVRKAFFPWWNENDSVNG